MTSRPTCEGSSPCIATWPSSPTANTDWYAGVVYRLGSIVEARQHVRSPAAALSIVHEVEARVDYEVLTRYMQGSDRVLVRKRCVWVLQGTRVLSVVPNDAAKVALCR